MTSYAFQLLISDLNEINSSQLPQILKDASSGSKERVFASTKKIGEE